MTETGTMTIEFQACKEFARNFGMDNPEQEWICTPFDSWERNPSYRGVKHVDPETAGEIALQAEESGVTLTEEDYRLDRVQAIRTLDNEPDEIEIPESPF
jgi:hypothetical protein